MKFVVGWTVIVLLAFAARWAMIRRSQPIVREPGAFNPLHDPVHGCLVLVVIGFVIFVVIALASM